MTTSLRKAQIFMFVLRKDYYHVAKIEFKQAISISLSATVYLGKPPIVLYPIDFDYDGKKCLYGQDVFYLRLMLRLTNAPISLYPPSIT